MRLAFLSRFWDRRLFIELPIFFTPAGIHITYGLGGEVEKIFRRDPKRVGDAEELFEFEAETFFPASNGLMINAHFFSEPNLRPTLNLTRNPDALPYGLKVRHQPLL